MGSLVALSKQTDLKCKTLYDALARKLVELFNKAHFESD